MRKKPTHCHFIISQTSMTPQISNSVHDGVLNLSVIISTIMHGHHHQGLDPVPISKSTMPSSRNRLTLLRLSPSTTDSPRPSRLGRRRSLDVDDRDRPLPPPSSSSPSPRINGRKPLSEFLLAPPTVIPAALPAQPPHTSAAARRSWCSRNSPRSPASGSHS